MNANKQKGLTLLELIVGIFVLALILGLGVPSFQEVVRNNRLTAQTNDLVTALNLARSEAIKRGVPVSVCASADQASCSGDDVWTTGWIVFDDRNGVVGAVDAGDVVVQAWQALDGPSALDATVASVQFQPTGRATTAPPVAVSFTLRKPGCAGPYARNITIGVSGRVDSAKIDCPMPPP